MALAIGLLATMPIFSTIFKLL